VYDFIAAKHFSGARSELGYNVNPAGITIVAGDRHGDS
jgi:hypothetical protein